jgi:CheY-like chemotaxis protein
MEIPIPPPARARILIVDDSWTIRAHLEGLLEGSFDCQTCADGPSALEAALAHPPDLILSDVMMEPYDGYELCRLLREQPLLKHIPLVLLTSLEDPDARAVALEKGAADLLSKPVRPHELLARLRALLELPAPL